MNRIWFKIQMLRTFKALPFFLCIFVLFAFVAYAVGNEAYSGFKNLLEPEKMQIAVVMPEKTVLEEYMITLLNDMQSVKNSINLIETDEKNAYEMLKNGTAVCVIEIPEEFIAQIMDGRNKPAQISVSSVRPIEGALIKELSTALAGILSKSQSYIYSSYYFMKERGADKAEIDALNQAINKNFIQTSLLRESMFKRKNIYSQSYDVKFIAGLYSLAVFCSAIGLSRVLSSEDKLLMINVRRAGFSPLFSASVDLLKAIVAYLFLSIVAYVVLLVSGHISGFGAKTFAIFSIATFVCGVTSAIVFGFSHDGEDMVPYTFIIGFFLFFINGGFIPDSLLPEIFKSVPNPLSVSVKNIAWLMMNRADLADIKQLCVHAAVLIAGFLVVFTIRGVKRCDI